jgi:CubicO group peptidase (beta-lactamase class C family)
VADPFALCGEVERRLVEDDVPALSVAVLCGPELACCTWGARTFDSDAINRRTLFQAGSVSKPVTAVGVLRLVAEGTLDLDADVNEYLTTWKVPSAGRLQERVTLRQLLTHTAGLTVHGFPGYARDARLPTLEQILDGVAPANTEAVRVATQPGSPGSTREAERPSYRRRWSR